MIVRALAVAGFVALAATLPLRSAHAVDDALSYMSPSTSEKPMAWTFNTPEQDARPGEYFFLKASVAFGRQDYRFAMDMYKTSASWGYKPSQYNLALMYFKGQGVTTDRPRAMAWMTLAAERSEQEYVDARDVLRAEMTAAELTQAESIVRELDPKYGDVVAVPRAKKRWAQVKAAMTGSRVGGIGALKVGAMSSNNRLVRMEPSGKSALDGNSFSAFGVLTGGSMDGATAYQQFRQSDSPYDPKFKPKTGTATVEPLIPIDDKNTPPAKKDDQPRNS